MKYLKFIIAMFVVAGVTFAFTVRFMDWQYSLEQPRQQMNEDELFNAVNNWRKTNNLVEYNKNQDLCSFADIRAHEVQLDWSHQGFQVHKEQIYKDLKFRRMGENLSRDFNQPVDALNGWLRSPSHRANLDFNFSESCIRCISSYCVQLFASY